MAYGMSEGVAGSEGGGMLIKVGVDIVMILLLGRLGLMLVVSE